MTNMAGNEVEEISRFIPCQVVNELAVVKLIRGRYSRNKIYVSNSLAARAVFFYLTAVSCFLTSRTLQYANYVILLNFDYFQHAF